MNEQGQYKDVVRMLNKELKEVREKLEEADCQKKKLQQEVMDLGKRVETVGTDAVRDFKALQSFIDSCAEYYGTGFDNCLKQIASAFPKLGLYGITMDDEGDSSPESNLPPKGNSVVVLAQPAANPPSTPASNSSAVIVDIENQIADKNPADTTAP